MITTDKTTPPVVVTKKLTIHPAAALGDVDDKVVDRLRNSMLTFGWSGEPIEIIWNDKAMEWQIIDGRHRQAAAFLAGIPHEIELRVVTPKANQTVYEYVLQRGHTRTIPPRVMMLYAVEKVDYSQYSPAQMLRIANLGDRASSNVVTIESMMKVHAERPDLFDKVKRRKKSKGGITLAAALRELGVQNVYTNKENVYGPSLRERYEILEAKYAEAKKEIRKVTRERDDALMQVTRLTNEVATLRVDLEEAERELGNI